MLSLLALVLAPFSSGSTSLADRDEPNHTRVTLVAENSSVEPGGTITFAAVFDIDKDWHIYWEGQNDTGQAPKFDTANLPAGVKLGEIGWPVPHRHVLPGDMVDHIYEKQAVVLLPLKVAVDAKPGTAFAFEIPLEWMECANVCRIASATLKAEFTVVEKAADAKPGTGAATIAAARKAMPAPLAKDSPVSVIVKGANLTITAKGADSIAFMPHLSSTELADLANQGEAKGDTLTASLIETKSGPTQQLPIVGIVAVRQGKITLYSWVDTAAKPEKKAESDPKSKSGARPDGTPSGR